MTFDVGLIFIFSAVFYGLYSSILTGARQRLWLVLIGSLLFYGSLEPKFLPVLLATSLIDFYIAQHLQGRRRNELLSLSVAINVGLLAFFKYRVWTPETPLIAPIGISFYVLQSLSYVFDVYRGDLVARRTPLAFLAGVSFFPHLLAGPILRSSDLLPQFESMPAPSKGEEARRAVLLIVCGLFKKNLADLLALQADTVFNAGHSVGFVKSWIGLLAFTGQIYGDFSGYSDIAIGFALLLGFHLPQNFNQPFTALSPVDYWTRWHMNLSRWFRDYVYSPLALTLLRRRLGSPYFAIILTMTLIGVWHGPRWTFVVFGLYHGFLIALTHVARHYKLSAPVPVQWALTFYLMILGHIFFRSSTLPQAFSFLRELHSLSGMQGFVVLPMIVIALVALHYASRLPELARNDAISWATAGAGFAVALALLGRTQPFIYFQF